MEPGTLWAPTNCFTVEAVPRTGVTMLSSKASSDFGDRSVHELRGIFALLLALSLHFLWLGYEIQIKLPIQESQTPMSHLHDHSNTPGRQ